ncbi:methylmalonyl Co-A mutase-associated GTPase MeaB [Neobacillus sp. MER 74]|uniref:methylmalonyl Co-A mutase-associated GTPase MeaB n=1 Tax=Neobacillus sp. MER 74 TaxID=2939566 RepID=UPI002040E075|nr:methylmalonyl Co-A mutase-associated GTPase MeaB [Neobacillus sp. MER 74]MCM3113716.1 methylmalonyl Co-A mutase-associated GTPase MeaB [Neobacillus sp. MER 74]
MKLQGKGRKKLSEDDYVRGILEGNRTILAQAITLIESHLPVHKEMAENVLSRILPKTGRSIRIGITGVPGAGKSTLIEALGQWLCERGHRVAVLAIDPSSTITRGSILGDKTRMDSLSRNPDAYIRPSATGGTLGGIARKTRETMLLCEAACYDVILIETVGVGQSEVTVRSMVDFFLLVTLTGAGDELQGIKKGVMELADAIVINKADGDNKKKAAAAKAEFNRILHFLKPSTFGWTSKAYTCSALEGDGIEEIWSVIKDFRQNSISSGIFRERRKKQKLNWMYSIVHEHLKSSFYSNADIQQIIPEIEHSVDKGSLTAPKAAKKLVEIFENTMSPSGSSRKEVEITNEHCL